MKKIITMCMFAVTLCMHAQKVNLKPAAIKSGINPSSQWIMVHKDGMVGYIDRNGTLIVPPVYDAIGPFDVVKEGLSVIESPAGLKGLIDTAGTVVVEPKYDFIENAGKYNKDWLKVELDGYTGFIDKEGNEVVAPLYDEVELPRKINSAPHVKMTIVK